MANFLSRLGWLGIFTLDRAIKWWVLYVVHNSGLNALPSVSLPLFGRHFTGAIVYVTNSGAAWGLLSGYPHALNAIRVCTVLAILIGVHLVRNLAPIARFCWIAIVVAALSNLCDVLVYGHIIDMFLLRAGNWAFAAFNIADAVICFSWSVLFLQHIKKAPSALKN